jgi:acetylornithine deacetylase
MLKDPIGLNAIGISQRGAQFFRIVAPGQDGGLDYKHNLVNPITKALEVFQAIEAYSIMREASTSHPLYDGYYNTKVPLGVCTISGGTWPSSIGSQCTMEGSIECLPGEDIREVRKNFKTYLEEWARKDNWLNTHPLDIQWFGLWFESAEIQANHPFVSVLSEVVESVTLKKPTIAGMGGCDLRLPVLYGDTPAVVYGPSGGMIHSTDEYVEFEQVIVCAKILALTALEWCGQV